MRRATKPRGAQRCVLGRDRSSCGFELRVVSPRSAGFSKKTQVHCVLAAEAWVGIESMRGLPTTSPVRLYIAATIAEYNGIALGIIVGRKLNPTVNYK